MLRGVPKGRSLDKKKEDDEALEATDTVPDNLQKLAHPATVSQGRLDSFSSVTSIYSADGGQGEYQISGRVNLGVWYKNETLFVRVVKAKNLQGANPGGLSDPYVKIYLLPDRTKHTKRKTSIQRKTNNPEYDEILKIRMERLEKDLSTIWLSIWNWDRFGRNLFLGEVRLPLSSQELTDSSCSWHTLQEKASEPEDWERGQLRISIKYDKREGMEKNSFLIAVKEATGLPKMDPHGLTDAAVRLFLLPRRATFSKKKTKIVKNCLNPVWNEQFEYKYVTFSDLSTGRVLELTVWDYDRRGCNDFIGCVRLGPSPDEADPHKKEWMDSGEEEMEHWTEMLAHPGEWVEAWHHLRPLVRKGTTKPSISGGPAVRVESLDLSDEEEGEKSDEDEDGYGSDTSHYSENGVKGEYDITGKLQLSLELKGKSLLVKIITARDLAAADSNGFSDPYIKTYLLPDKSKHSKRKTAVKRKTLNPVFNETMRYEVEKTSLSHRTLWLTVWDWDKFGKNEFLGEVMIPLKDAHLDGTNHDYTLEDSNKSSIAQPTTSLGDNRGTLILGLKFELTGYKNGLSRGKLHIHVQAAKTLPNMDDHGYTDGFVKLYLLPNKSSKGQRKTCVIKDNLNPCWNERFVYDKMSLENMSSKRALEVTVWDHNMVSSNDFVGGLRIGPSPGKSLAWMDSTPEEASHWEEMLDCPGEWVERTHVLRRSLDYRDTTSSPEPTVVASPPVEEDTTIFLHRGSGVIHKGVRPKRTSNPSKS